MKAEIYKDEGYQLYAHLPATRRLPVKLWAQRHAWMEAIHSPRVDGANPSKR